MTCPDPQPGPFFVGNAIEANFTLVTLDTGQPYDPPGGVFAWSRSPSGSLTTLTAVRLAPGSYQAVFTPNVPGPWIARAADSATPPTTGTVVREKRFAVRPLDY